MSSMFPMPSSFVHNSGFKKRGFRRFPTGYRPYFILISDIALESERIIFVHRASQKLHFNVLLKMPCFIHNNTGSSHSVLCGHLAPVVQKVDNPIQWIALSNF